MAIVTKSYILSDKVTTDLFPERLDRNKQTFELAIKKCDEILEDAKHIDKFKYKDIIFNVSDTAYAQKAVDFIEDNDIDWGGITWGQWNMNESQINELKRKQALKIRLF